MAICPEMAPDVFWLIVAKIIFTAFLICAISNPLLIDYIEKKSLGQSAMLGTLGFVGGEILAILVLL
jgi:hypothetical protein